MQRQSCLAFIENQRTQGWEPIETPFDDHGISGATTDRPGFNALMAAVEAGNVNAVIVYRLDRLSRSVLDFVQILDCFERYGCAFVSVSEQFNTDTPIGRFTLGILMGISQLERETIAQRTKDKMVAARKQGRSPPADKLGPLGDLQDSLKFRVALSEVSRHGGLEDVVIGIGTSSKADELPRAYGKPCRFPADTRSTPDDVVLTFRSALARRVFDR